MAGDGHSHFMNLKTHRKQRGWEDKLRKQYCQFCGENEYIVYDPVYYDKICATMQPILDFINKASINYAEIGDYIFVHGWIPCFQHLDDFREADESDWNEAMWLNGMDMWRNPKNRIEGKTIVCGHYHVNWGHARIHHECSEWGDDTIFKPFIDEGIIALDTCTAYSGKINVLVVENS